MTVVIKCSFAGKKVYPTNFSSICFYAVMVLLRFLSSNMFSWKRIAHIVAVAFILFAHGALSDGDRALMTRATVSLFFAPES